MGASFVFGINFNYLISTTTYAPPMASHVYSDYIAASGPALTQLGAYIFPPDQSPIEGTLHNRRPDGNCGFYVLSDSNELEVAMSLRNSIAEWIYKNPDHRIGNHTILEHIRFEWGSNINPLDYFNHTTAHDRAQHFQGN